MAAAASMAASSLEAANLSHSLPSFHSPHSLLLQSKILTRKISVTCLKPGRVVGEVVGLSYKNPAAARSKFLKEKTYPRKTLVNALSEPAATEEENAEANTRTASVDVDEESLKEENGIVARVDENSDVSMLSESQGLNLMANGLPHQVSNGAPPQEYRIGSAVDEGSGAPSHESNTSAYTGSNEAISTSSDGTADHEDNEAANPQKDDTKFEESNSILKAIEIAESESLNETAEFGGAAGNGAVTLATKSSPLASEVGSLNTQLQSDKEDQPDVVQPYALSLSNNQDGEMSAKDKVESIGQEAPWFKQAGKEKTRVSVAAGGRWNQFKTYSTIQRTCEIWLFVAIFVFKAWLINQKFAYKGGITEEKKKEKRKLLAKWLKESLLRLGPTFIKIGQQFSTRVDILPQEYVEQLTELQDQVPPFESEMALKIVEDELGAPVGEVFDQFDPDPVAAASLGQVHRAVYKSEEVVVKVQRPGLKELFDIDLKNLRVIAGNLQKLDPKSDGAKRDWVAIYDECASVLYEEIDYRKEGANAERFASNFKDLEYVRVPKVYWDCTTPQVLTMEYVPGIKINRIAALDQLGVDRKKLAQYAVESYLEQILRHGFFHADPHPGNIAVDDENGGRLIFYDFGMMGSISSNIREGLLEAFYGVYEKDPDKVLQAMVQMGVLVPTGDMTAVRRTAQFFLNSFEERLAAQRAEREAEKVELGFKKPLTKEERIEKRKKRLASIGEDLLSISVDQPFRFPATFTFVVRAFSVLDGIGKGLDPRFDISEIAKPYAFEILKFREFGYDVIIRDLKKRWKRQAQAFSNLFRQADRVEKLAEVIQRLEQGDLKLRVRTLESERAFKRMATMQQSIGQAVLAGVLLNLATILQLHAIRAPALAAFAGSAMIGVNVLIGLLKLKKLDKQEKLITGTA